MLIQMKMKDGRTVFVEAAIVEVSGGSVAVTAQPGRAPPYGVIEAVWFVPEGSEGRVMLFPKNMMELTNAHRSATD